MAMSGQHYSSAALYPRERTPDTNYMGGWVGLRTGPETKARGKILTSAGDRPPVVQSVVNH